MYRVLVSVAEMVDRGMRVIFEKVEGNDASRVEIPGMGETIPMKRKQKVCVMEWKASSTRSGFGRQGGSL